MLFVTHDLGLAEQIADRIVVMKDGRIVEEGQSEQIFRDPQHAYTKKLLGYATYGKGGSHYHGRIRAAEQEKITQKEATTRCFPSAGFPKASRLTSIRASRCFTMSALRFIAEKL